MAYSNSEKAILKAVLYSDIFDFPLSKNELWHFLISDKKISKVTFEHALSNLSQELIYKNGFYCLAGKEENIKRRKKNLSEARKKLDLARKTADILSYIPTISFIGLSGGAAMGNVKEGDDVDLFIITKKNTLFMTRFWVLALLEAIGLRRKRHENGSSAANKICVNLLIDELALAWPSRKHDLYTAHEIVQVKPLFERRGMYKKFLASNNWVNKFFPNVFTDVSFRQGFASGNNFYTLKALNAILSLPPVPLIVRMIQKKVMKRNQTRETITDTILAFHPHDYRKETLDLLRHRYSKFRLLTNP
jgi:hypothetical protein